jgi:hypothetical protein
MKIGSFDRWARAEISVALFLRSDIGLIVGIADSFPVVSILYHYRDIVKGRRPAHNNRVYDALSFVKAGEMQRISARS